MNVLYFVAQPFILVAEVVGIEAWRSGGRFCKHLRALSGDFGTLSTSWRPCEAKAASQPMGIFADRQCIRPAPSHQVGTYHGILVAVTFPKTNSRLAIAAARPGGLIEATQRPFSVSSMTIRF
jgi:hypothetical protein